MARTALQRFIRGRAIECELPRHAEAKRAHETRCTVGGDDIALWLVEQGWAKPAGDRYAEAGEKARAERLGLWQEGAAPGAQMAGGSPAPPQ
ncbi:thermonuclease family protein [Rhizobiales bacterium L72]|uniref:Thermonuclease family protein n=2 Tax=Propylenella binzhouense TaxID=2555902 RepID=A0A964T846_9HYPH|nr:thermonuclease family protein [Propylenella binzhouense]